MTLDEEYAKYQGQSLLVPGQDESLRGQCAQWSNYVLHDVYGLPYHAGNAIDWFNDPQELLDSFDKVTDGSVKKGDFVVFNQNVGSEFGHIDVAMQDGTSSIFQGSDSNWGGNLTVHLVQHSNRAWVLGALRLKEEEMSTIGDVEARILIKHIYGYTSEVDIEGAIPGLLGGESNTIIRMMDATPTAAAYQKQIKEWASATPVSVKPYSGPQLFVKP